MPPTQLSGFHPSPKRKRDPPPYVPHVNTTLRNAVTPPRGSPIPAGAESPRNAVADQLRGMSIAAIPMSPLTPTDDVVRKKPRFETVREDSATSLEDFTDGELLFWEKERVNNSPDGGPARAKAPVEVPERPQAPQAQRPRIFSDLVSFAQPTTFGSPPDPKGTSQQSRSLDNSPSKAKDCSPQSRPRNRSPSPPLTSLTWQDSEITGHLVDPSKDPEDDGTGLNGIGFRPTPALAHQRAQRRKQQLMDYRAREAREARAKRSERRRRGVGGAGIASREGTVERETTAKEAEAIARRAVRFAI